MEETVIHIGNLVKKELQWQDLSISWLSLRIYRDSSNVNKMLQKLSMHTDVLLRVSLVLRHNFFDEIAPLLQTKLGEKLP